MIDKLVIQIPLTLSAVKSGQVDHGENQDYELEHEMHGATPWFERKGTFWVEPQTLPCKLSAGSIHYSEGEVELEDIRCPWESLPSSHAGVAFKCYHKGNGTLAWPYIEIKASPAKIAQGHNVWGTDQVYPCIENLLFVFCCAYPEFVDRKMLDINNARLSEIDITYSTRIESEAHRKALLDTIRHTSKGQTKNRGDSYETTVYFGAKKSRLRKIKVYLKGPELIQEMAKLKREGKALPNQQVQDTARHLVRFELTIKKDWLERRLLPTNLWEFSKLVDDDPAMLRTMYVTGCKDLFTALSGEVVTVSNDREVSQILEDCYGGTRGRPAKLMGFYQGLKAIGWDQMKETYPERTWRRYIKELEDAGFSRAHLCALHTNKGATVIQFPTMVTIDHLCEPAPDNYEYPLLAAAV